MRTFRLSDGERENIIKEALEQGFDLTADDALETAFLQHGRDRMFETDQTATEYVYILNAKGSDFYKIGRSDYPDKRIKQLSIQLPFPAEVIAVFRTLVCLDVEEYLHFTYRHKYLNGEWFKLDHQDIEQISAAIVMAKRGEKIK